MSFMELFKKIQRQFIYPTCAVFTIVCFVFTAVIFSVKTDFKTPGATPAGLGLFLLFSFLLVCANQLFHTKLSLALCVFLHYLAVTADFCVCFLLIGGYYASTGTQALIVLLAVTLIYFVIAIPCLIIRRICVVRKRDGKKYQKVFSKAD